MSVAKIPKEVSAAIRKCWPDGVIEQFDCDESYFHEVHIELARDLAKISGAMLRWQTRREDRDYFHDDDDDGEMPLYEEFQSYHVFFLAPKGDEFRFEDETEDYKDRDDMEDDEDSGEEPWVEAKIAGEGWLGCAAQVSLVAPFAQVHLSQYGEYEDGTTMCSESLDMPPPSDKRLAAELDKLRANIAKVLAKHGIQVLDESVLGLHVPKLKADEEVFLGEEIHVRDAFFFRGV